MTTTVTHRLLFLVAALVAFILLIVLILIDSTSTKLESILLPLGLACGFASFL